MSIRHHPFYRQMSGGDWWDVNTPSSLFDQHFGNVIDRNMNDPLFRPSMPMAPYWMRPQWNAPSSTAESGVSNVKNDDDNFSISLDVRHFSPEEIKVKTVDNNVLVEAKHEEKMDDHGFVSRQFTRKYVLPKEVDPVTVISSLGANGTLTITAPKKKLDAQTNERTIPISFSPAPALDNPMSPQ